MCGQCDYMVDRCTAAFNMMVEVVAESMRENPDRTPAQHIMYLAAIAMDSIPEAAQEVAEVQELAIGMSIAVHRLIGVQDIHGIPVT